MDFLLSLTNVLKMNLRFLANQGSFESKEKLTKVEVFILTWVLWCEDLVCASVRHPSRSSGHLSVAVQCVQ